MFTRGDRVKVNDNHPLSGEYGYVVCERATGDDTIVRVVLDGNPYSSEFLPQHLLPVEVVTHEGTLYYHIGAEDADFVSGDKRMALLGLFSDCDGDDIRITIERVKKEG